MADTIVENATAEPRIIANASKTPQEQFEIDDSNAITNVAEDETVYPRGFDRIVIVIALCIVLVALGFDISVVAVTIPALSDQFKSLSDIAWYSTALRLVMCSMMFFFGKAFTLFSVKRLFMVSLIVFEIGNIISTFAQNSIMFIVGRAICGLGCSGLSAGVFTIFTLAFPMRQRALLGGLGGAVETLAAIASPVAGGALVTHWTWRACFGVNIPLGLLGSAFIFFFLKLKPNPNESLPLKEKIKRLDLLGTGIFAPAMTCLLIALQWGGSVYAWNSAQVIALLVLSMVLLASFLWIEGKSGERASIPLRIMKNRSLLAGAFFGLCCNATVSVVEYYISIYFQGVRGYTAAQSGLFALPMVGGMCLAAPIAGAVTTWFGYYFQNMYVSAVLASIAVGVLTTIDIETRLATLLAMLGLLGIAFGSGIQAPQIAAQTVMRESEASIGIGVVQFGTQIGPVLFLSASGALFANRLNEEIKLNAPTTNLTSIENMGLTDIRNAIGPDALKGVLTGYNEALVQTLYLPLALACVSIVGCFAMERKNVKTERQQR